MGTTRGLRGIGFKSDEDCENINDNYLIQKCKKEMKNMIKHILILEYNSFKLSA